MNHKQSNCFEFKINSISKNSRHQDDKKILQMTNQVLFKFISLILLHTVLSLITPYAIAEEIQQNYSSKAIETRLHNIDLMRNVLKKDEYSGYDIIIISSTTREEADCQQQMFEKAFAGSSKKNRQAPLILSVLDSTEGGQLIGGVYTWLKAEEKMREQHPELIEGYQNLMDYIRKNNCKVAAYHNGGRGERFSPLTQSLGNSRGAQKLVGTITNAQKKKLNLMSFWLSFFNAQVLRLQIMEHILIPSGPLKLLSVLILMINWCALISNWINFLLDSIKTI